MMVRVHACILASIVYTRKHGVHEGGPALTWAGADRVNLMALWLPTVGADFEHNMRSIFLEVKLCSSIRDATTARATELSAVGAPRRGVGGRARVIRAALPSESAGGSDCAVGIRGRRGLAGVRRLPLSVPRCVSQRKQGVCSSTYDDAHGSLSNRLMGFIRTKAPTHL
jgi:hypothetical protein